MKNTTKTEANQNNTENNKTRRTTKSREERRREKLLSDSSSFYMREAYKTLRTNIMFSMPHEGCKKLIVTSSLAAEGKSTNCMNIALTFAETGARVCIMDCDLRRPNVHRLMNVDPVPGLSNALIGMNTVNDIIRHSQYQNLDFISAGDTPPNPAELLGSERVKELLDEIENNYDYIFIDTCPVNVVTDTAIVSKVVPDVIMVVLQNSTEKDSLKDAVNQLEFAGAKIIGFILNGVEYTSKGGYKYRYGAKYYRAGGRYSRYTSYYRKYGYGDNYGYDSRDYGKKKEELTKSAEK